VLDDAVTIRPARESDLPALQRLAERDCASIPDGSLLVAERDGEIDAALAIESGAAIADPFKPTADLVSLLRARAKLLRKRPPRHTDRRLRLGLAGETA